MMRSLLMVSVLLTFNCSLLLAVVHGQALPSWTRIIQAGGSQADEVYATTSDAAGNTYQTGYFIGSFQAGNQALTVGGTATYDMYVVKYDAQGNVVWAHQATSQANASTLGTALGSAVAVDVAGNVYVSGYFRGAITFGSSASTLTSTTSAPAGYVVKYSPQGVVLRAFKLQATSQVDIPGLAISAAGDIYLAGYFAATLTLSGSTLSGQNKPYSGRFTSFAGVGGR